MQLGFLAAVALITPSYALLRFGCSQLVVQRTDPLVNPGMAPSPHVHQIIGGNSFNITMDPKKDMPASSTCTTCQFAENFSNYWTAILYFKARNGTYKRVPQIPNSGFEAAKGGMTVYYIEDSRQQAVKTTAFKPGFRMIIGNPTFTTRAEAQRYRQLTYTCLKNINTRSPETLEFPDKPCPAGIMVNLRFPTCWDGVNLDSPDHMAHMSYPESGTFESGGPCPASHPVRTAQLFFEVIFDTKPFNDPKLWPEDGSQPFVWSFGDTLGYGNHGDYMFGWKGDALQRVLDSKCYVNCPILKTQSFADMNKCSQKAVVDEDIEGWLPALPGRSMEREFRARGN
ncbi:hypothetical protein M501DRAFT_1006782 [Patellaria atrata CBS 101060]|uniref:DUF1996 domain-containing protein n=1 Tax=Patellaria atrata CBS 101060 TaxID=1346257 RepID=A0A9P4VPG8_9PEZI|nr:hypothetical protein M501DRAFT_1006782 [Patellaria atrata CBS 101060]